MRLEIGKSKSGDALHYSIGAIIKHDDKFLLINRAIEPFGFAVLAGHLNNDEDPETAVARVVEEESNLKVTDCHLVYEGETPKNWCSRGIGVHYWRVYECEVEGQPSLNFLHTKTIGWYTVLEMKKLKFDSAVEYLFDKMKIF